MEFAKETSLETIESQTQPELLYSELPNRVEEVKKKRELKSAFEVMANLAGDVDATPTMVENVEVDVGVPLGHDETIHMCEDGPTVPLCGDGEVAGRWMASILWDKSTGVKLARFQKKRCTQGGEGKSQILSRRLMIT